MGKSLLYCFILIVIIMVSAVASAAGDFGVQSYPGARSDADTQAVCEASGMGIMKEREEQSGLIHTKRCYRTNDYLAKVIDFYKKQKGLKRGIAVDEPSIKSVSFCLSETGVCHEGSIGTLIDISAPWIVPDQTMANNDLLIFITTRVKK